MSCQSCQVQGPTDVDTRAASCWWVNNVLGTAGSGLDGPPLSRGGRPVPGFGIGAAAGDITSTLNQAQLNWTLNAWAAWINANQAWVSAAQANNASVPTQCMGASASGAPQWGCFQQWFSTSTGAVAIPQTNVLDAATLAALQATMVQNNNYGSTIVGAYPGTTTNNTAAASTSTTTYVVAGVAAVAVLGAGWAVLSSRRKKAA